MPDYLTPPDLPTTAQPEGGGQQAESRVEEYAFSSSNLAYGQYDARKQELVLSFNKGASYLYGPITQEMWIGLKLAGSAGNYFRDVIMGLMLARLS